MGWWSLALLTTVTLVLLRPIASAPASTEHGASLSPSLLGLRQRSHKARTHVTGKATVLAAAQLVRASATTGSVDDDDDDDDEDCGGAVRKGPCGGPLGPQGSLTVVVNGDKKNSVEEATKHELQKALSAEHKNNAVLMAQTKNTEKEVAALKAELNAANQQSAQAKAAKEMANKQAKDHEQQQKKIDALKQKLSSKHNQKLLEQSLQQEYEQQSKRTEEEATKQYGVEQKNAKDAEQREQEQKEAAANSKEIQVAVEPPNTNWGGKWETATGWLDDDLCMLSGLVRGDGGLLVRLPPQCTPGGGRLVFSTMKTDKPARVDILADGRVYYITGGGPTGWVSLNGLSFVTKQNDPFKLTNGWKNFGGLYRRSGISKHLDKFCVASGMIKGETWSYMGRFPDACIPNARMVMTANNGADVARIDILNDGFFLWNGGYKNHGYVSIDGMMWSPTGGAPLQLAGNWRNYGGTFRPAMVDRAGDYCVLSGLVINTQGWTRHVAILPPHCRPGKRMVFGGNNQMTAVRIDVWENGEVVYISGKMSWNWLSLSGIHFTVSPELRSGGGETEPSKPKDTEPTQKANILAPPEDIKETADSDMDHHRGDDGRDEAPAAPDELCEVEMKVVQYTNELRKKEGKKELKLNRKMSDIARGHSQNMGDGKATFGHTGFNERVKHFAFNVKSASENLYASFSKNGDMARLAVDAWMKSPGHKQNLLGNYNSIGVGIYKKGSDWWFVQMFALGDAPEDKAICQKEKSGDMRFVADSAPEQKTSSEPELVPKVTADTFTRLTKENKPFVAMFGRSGCQLCQKTKPNLAKVAAQHKNVPFVWLDFSDGQSVSDLYTHYRKAAAAAGEVHGDGLPFLFALKGDTLSRATNGGVKSEQDIEQLIK